MLYKCGDFLKRLWIVSPVLESLLVCNVVSQLLSQILSITSSCSAGTRACSHDGARGLPTHCCNTHIGFKKPEHTLPANTAGTLFFPTFLKPLTSSSLPWSSSHFSFSAPEGNITCYQPQSAPRTKSIQPSTSRNPPTSFMASSICLSSSYRSLDSLSGCTIVSSICGNS